MGCPVLTLPFPSSAEVPMFPATHNGHAQVDGAKIRYAKIS